METTPHRRKPNPLIFFLFLLPFLPLVAVQWRKMLPPPPSPFYKFPTKELARLDKVIQARFAIVPEKDFGAGRVGPRHDYFIPANQIEKEAINDLRRKNQEVVFYVVGRESLLRLRSAEGIPPVQGPIYMTSAKRSKVVATNDGTAPSYKKDEEVFHPTHLAVFRTLEVPKDLPDAQTLYKPAREALEEFSWRQGKSFEVEKWKVEAVPVPASHQACVNCHNSWEVAGKPDPAQQVRLGEPIGVAMYLHRKRAEIAKPK